jgi:hypothetical protein
LRHGLLSAIATAHALLISAAAARVPQTGPVIDRVDTLGPYLGACIEKRLAGEPFTGQREAIFSVSFRRDGSIFGQPARTHSFPAANTADQAKFLRMTEEAIRSCAPLPFSKALGEAIAGRPYRFRYIFKPNKDQPA